MLFHRNFLRSFIVLFGLSFLVQPFVNATVNRGDARCVIELMSLPFKMVAEGIKQVASNEDVQNFVSKVVDQFQQNAEPVKQALKDCAYKVALQTAENFRTVAIEQLEQMVKKEKEKTDSLDTLLKSLKETTVQQMIKNHEKVSNEYVLNNMKKLNITSETE